MLGYHGFIAHTYTCGGDSIPGYIDWHGITDTLFQEFVYTLEYIINDIGYP